VILIFSAIAHEIAHGYAALYCGDPTAKYEGRLTFNPLKHLDLWGSIIIPLTLLLSGSGLMFGWAKPVPYNPYNLKNLRRSEIIISLAGPLTNLTLAVIFSLVFRLFVSLGQMSESLMEIFLAIILVNLVLGLFNLVPLPPLDGFKIFSNLLPRGFAHIRDFLEKFGFIFVLIFIFFGWTYISPIIVKVFEFLVGIQLNF